MNELEEPWKSAAERKGMDSFGAIARVSGISKQTVIMNLTGQRRPSNQTAEKLAIAFGVPRTTIDAWAGIAASDTADAYSPPQEAGRLTLRQRRAVDEIIMAMVEPRATADTIDHSQRAYDFAANAGSNRGRVLHEESLAHGEESQDFGDDH